MAGQATGACGATTEYAEYAEVRRELLGHADRRRRTTTLSEQFTKESSGKGVGDFRRFGVWIAGRTSGEHRRACLGEAVGGPASVCKPVQRTALNHKGHDGHKGTRGRTTPTVGGARRRDAAARSVRRTGGSRLSSFVHFVILGHICGQGSCGSQSRHRGAVRRSWNSVTNATAAYRQER